MGVLVSVVGVAEKAEEEKEFKMPDEGIEIRYDGSNEIIVLHKNLDLQSLLGQLIKKQYKDLQSFEA